ncbi:DUF1128 family protein [Fervidibacillus halotolerans]|uniref:DUF1128 domain-containing protein n=1 Tax=Fervidibacillus halotolerans TaxID=2980027 RepID=A0A9E8LZN5_9BACI|nr:DUF1128 family protein [Fervidibacillus halotolerans]WAA12778.1 DUF1128 domain-containing protein [Fervidibacillus halotolerans]
MDTLLSEILDKLKIINKDVVRPGSLNESAYEDLISIYEYVMKKDHFSPNEMKEIVEELGRLRAK